MEIQGVDIMAIKYKAKDTDDLEKELEEWSMNMNLFQTVATSDEKEKVVKIESDELADDHSKRSTYENEELKNSDL